jgi:hypothetical protein
MEEITTTCNTTGETTTTRRHNPNGKLSNWIHIALDKRKWDWHIHKLTHPNSPAPPYPQDNERQQQHHRRTNEQDDSHMPPPGRRNNNTNNNRERDHRYHRHEQERHAPPDPSRNHERQDYNIDNVGNNKIDSLKALGLNSQATPSEIKHRFRRLSLIYHPDKYSDAMQISKEQATAHFQLINNAHDFLRKSG